jgi:hypothetical protein
LPDFIYILLVESTLATKQSYRFLRGRTDSLWRYTVDFLMIYSGDEYKSISGVQILPDFLHILLMGSTLATKQSYRILKWCADPLWRYIFSYDIEWRWLQIYTRCTNFARSFLFFVSGTYSSYETVLQNYETLRRSVVEICFFI